MVVKSIFDKDAHTQILERINKLTPQSQALWGKMNVSQMLKHCNENLKLATKELALPRLWIGWLIGGFLKSTLTNDKPLDKNSPTHPSFVMVEKVDFDIIKLGLFESLEKLAQNGEKSTEGILHPFFGKLTSEQWAKGIWKHLDHHLKQFGV